MKTKSAFYMALLAGLMFSFLFSCKKEANITAPNVTIVVVTDITATSATSGGEITSDGGATVTSCGVCWSANQNPITTDSKTSNSIGTAYGNQISLTTTSSGGIGTVTDIDGNVYKTISIGTQVWMVENLKTTKYRNGDPIPNITGDQAWNDLTT